MIRKIIFGLVICLLVLSNLVLLSGQTSAASSFMWSQQQWETSTDMSGVCLGAMIDTTARGRILEMTWASGFDLTGLTVSDTDTASELEIFRGSVTCGGTARVTEVTDTPANNRDVAVVIGQMMRLTFEDDYSGLFSFKFVDKTDANLTSIVTPAIAGNYTMLGVEKFTVTGQPTAGLEDFVYVGNLNQVDITADVDPSLTFSLSTTACNLGTLDIANIKTCSYGTEVSTNAAAGYTGYLKSDGAFRNTSNQIADVTGGTIAAASEAYGVSTTSSAGSLGIFQINDADISGTYMQADCTTLNNQNSIAMTSTALTTSDQSFSASTGPTDLESIYVCHAVGITATTPAGSYSQLVTVTVIGNF